MRGAVCAASRLRAGASRALGASKRFGSAKTLPQAGFKRSCLPDGPKVGSVTLSPRGDWRMPSDAVASLWLEELEGLE